MSCEAKCWQFGVGQGLRHQENMEDFMGKFYDHVTRQASWIQMLEKDDEATAVSWRH